MRIGFLTTLDNPLLPHFLLEAHSACLNVFVICDKKKISEKDQAIWFERTAGLLDEGNIYNSSYPFYFVDNHNSDDALSLIDDLRLDCLFNAGTPRKLSKVLLDSVEHGVINVHPGVLPKYRGCSCVEWSLYNGDPVGNTAHFMNIEYDAGPIIEIETLDCIEGLSYIDIRVQLYTLGCKLAISVLKEVERRGLRPLDLPPQDEGRLWEPMPDHIFEELKLRDKNWISYENCRNS